MYIYPKILGPTLDFNSHTRTKSKSFPLRPSGVKQKEILHFITQSCKKTNMYDSIMCSPIASTISITNNTKHNQHYTLQLNAHLTLTFNIYILKQMCHCTRDTHTWNFTDNKSYNEITTSHPITSDKRNKLYPADINIPHTKQSHVQSYMYQTIF